MLKPFAYIAPAVLLIGCASNPAELRRVAPDHVGSFIVEQSYESTYGLLLERQRACEHAGLLTGKAIVQGELHPETRSGSISAAMEGVFGIDTHTILDVHAMDERSARVTVYSSRYQPDAYIFKLGKWLIGSRRCYALPS
jgi:hypothetical protein